MDRLDEQIRLLYGPLVTQAQQNDGAWRVFKSSAMRMSGDMDTYWKKIRDPDAKEHRHWKEWNETVFVPLNEKICSILAENSHLVDAVTYPESFSLLNRHVAGWRAIIQEWQRGEASQTGPDEWFPENISAEIMQSFNKCLKRQREVLRKTGRFLS